MIRIWKAGTLPELQHVAHTNFADIGFALRFVRRRRLVIVSMSGTISEGRGRPGSTEFSIIFLGVEEQTGLQYETCHQNSAGALVRRQRNCAVARRTNRFACQAGTRNFWSYMEAGVIFHHDA